MNRVFSLLFALLFMLSGLPLQAQGRVAQTDVDLQKKLIEANREKLLGNYDKALAILEELRAQKKEEDALLYEMARIYVAREEPEKSIPLLEEAIRINPANHWYRETLALHLEQLGRFSEAAANYALLRKDFPREKDYYFREALMLIQNDEPTAAIKVYDDWEKTAGPQSETFLRKHQLYVMAGNEKKAIKELENLIQHFPYQTDYRHLLASYLTETGNTKDAEAVYKAILQTDPYDDEARLALAANAQEKSNTAAEGIASELLPLFEKEDISIDAKIAKILPALQQVAETGDNILATDLLRLTTVLEKVHSNDAKAFAASADLYFNTGQLAEARSRYEKTLALDDRNFMVWENLFYCLQALEEWAALQTQTEFALDIFPNKGSVYYFNGIASCELSDFENALDVLEQAELIFSLDKQQLPRVLLAKGKVLQNMNDVAAAESAFKEALALAPQSPQVMHGYAMFFSRKEAYPEAQKWLENALEKGGDKSSLILENYGDVWYRLGEPDKALEYWTKAQKLNNGGSKWLSKKIADKKLYE